MQVIALDLGGTKLAGAIFDKEGKILEQRVDLLNNRRGDEVGELIQNQIIGLLETGNSKNYQIKGIGISVPGIYYAGSGKVWAPNIAGWENFPLLDRIAAMPEAANRTVKIDSDRACYIFGETWQGKARGCRDAIFLAIGTGIGAGILVDGKIVRGANDIAGAVGWFGLQKPYFEKYLNCGQFEYYASGDGIARTALEFLDQAGTETSVLKNMPFEKLTAREVFAAFEQGDVLAQKVLDRVIEFWGMAAANLVSTFNPEKIIFGGGVFGPAEKFLDKIFNEAKKWAQPIGFKNVTFEVSALGSDAGLIGAGYLAVQAIYE